MKRVLLLSTVLPLLGLLLAPRSARSSSLDITSAPIADVEKALNSGGLTSEKLIELYLARIAAYDKQGPVINAVITLNPKALDEARALDAERKAKGPRSPIHGIPVVLKDNYNTFDLPTTGGCKVLEGSLPPADAFVVKKLRDAGAIILAKLNMSEFALGGGAPNGFSSMGGQTKNPHDLTKGPSGSSGGTGASIAAAFALFGMGTDTGGSIRGPSSVNGIAGLKPTRGLLSRNGIIPLALSRDTGGPMARNVSDIATVLGIMTGVDPGDEATRTSAGKYSTDYTQYLKVGALRGARIGVARDFFGKDPQVIGIMEEAILKLKELGATVIDPVTYPAYFLSARGGAGAAAGGRRAGGAGGAAPGGGGGGGSAFATEFKAQLAVYLATLKPGYPRTLEELVAKAEDPATGYSSPWKLASMKQMIKVAQDYNDPTFQVTINEGYALTRATVLAVMAENNLDALIYPTETTPATPIGKGTFPGDPGAGGGGAAGGPGGPGGGGGAAGIANETGFPDLIVPAGMTKDGLPVTISFFGPAYSEGKLIGYGYDFERATKARVLPKFTPELPTDVVIY